jgi:hypothetical protein
MWQFGTGLVLSCTSSLTSKNSLSGKVALACAALLGFAPIAFATPYASGLTNTGTEISFRLNEAADNVKIVSSGGTVTNDLGARPAGLNTAALTIAGSYEVHVYKSSAPGYASAISPNRGAVLQISTDNNLVRFVQPRGLAINTDPASPYFGRVYIANGGAGTTTTGARAVGKGIYMLNADLTDAVGQGDTARTGGIGFASVGTVSPYRLSIGEDGQIYVTDWSDTTGSLYVVDPNVTDGSGMNVLGGPTGSTNPVTTARIHGSIAAAIVTGSLSASNLTAFVIDEDLQTDRTATGLTMINSLWRHDIGGALPGEFVMPTFLRQGHSSNWINFASQQMDLSRGPNGYFYVHDYRSAGTDRSSVTILDTNGTNVIWASREATRLLTGIPADSDLLRASGGGGVSPRGDYLGVINIETNGITVVPLIDGIPDLTNRLVFHGMGNGSQGREVAFDIAGNLYAVSQGTQILRVFAPGGTATAITGSDGTFNIVAPAPVRVFAQDDQGSEEGPDTISFNIVRDGSTDAPLTVVYTLAGTAANGVDYETNTLSAVIPAGETNVVVVITPIDDALGEPAETVILTVVATSEYNTGTPVRATGTIADNEPVIALAVIDSEGNEELNDPVVFEIYRSGGRTDVAVTVLYSLTGTAVNGTDYDTNTLSVVIPAGETNVFVTIVPIDDSEAEFAETVRLTVLVSPDYTRDPPNNRTGVIGDNERPTLTIVSTGIDPYERFGSNGYTFTITRRGLTNGDVFIVLSASGTAEIFADYFAESDPMALYMTNGSVTTNITIMPVDDTTFEGNETVTLTLIENDYAVEDPGSATATIIDDECPPETVLFSDNLNTDTSADWIIRSGANNNVVDHTINWAFDYFAAYGIPAAPSSGGADTIGLRVTANKNDNTFQSAGVNLYPRNQTFSGDFALRFDLFISVGNSNSTEHTLAGINHSTINTNRASQDPTNHISTAGSDGVWFAMEAAAGALRDYAAFISTNAATPAPWVATRTAASLASVITRPPYSFVGAMGNASNSVTKTWAQVEISQTGNIVALKVNKRNILSVTNTSAFRSGDVMIGYNDQFGSRGSLFNFAIFDNVRVVRLGISITDVERTGNTVQLDFTASEGETAEDFRIESTEHLEPAYWQEETGATIVPNGDGFRATVQSTTDTRFYRVAK